MVLTGYVFISEGIVSELGHGVALQPVMVAEPPALV